MNTPGSSLRAIALEAYENSDLWMEDATARAAERRGLGELLRCLGVRLEPEQSSVEVDEITIDAFYEPPMFPVGSLGIRTGRKKDRQGDVFFRAHTKCSRCGEMRHSDQIGRSFDAEHAAAELGRWLSQNHECPSDKGQIGFRSLARTSSAATAQEESP